VQTVGILLLCASALLFLLTAAGAGSWTLTGAGLAFLSGGLAFIHGGKGKR
jgi:hypothetical protein